MSVITILQAAGVNPFKDSEPGVSSRSDQLLKSTAALKPGEEIQGVIAKPLPGGRAVVTILGRDMELALPKPLPTGTPLTFTVLRTAPNIELKLLQESIDKGRNGAEPGRPLPESPEDGPGQRLARQAPQSRGGAGDQLRSLRRQAVDTQGANKAALAPERSLSQKPDLAPNRGPRTNPYETRAAGRETSTNARETLEFVGAEKLSRMFSAGDTFTARVLKTGPSQKVEIAFNRQSADVDVKAPLKEGEIYLFKVTRTEPEVELKPLKSFGGDQAAASRSGGAGETRDAPLGETVGELKTAVETLLRENPESPRLSVKLELLSRVLNEIVYNDEKTDQKDFLQIFFRRTGQTLERAIFKEGEGTLPESGKASIDAENVKSIALNFLREWEELGEARPKNTGEDKLISQVAKLAESVEAEQTRNTHTFPTEGTLKFQIPFAFHESVSTGWLSLRFDFSKGKSFNRGESKEIMMVFFLDLTKLGAVRVDAGLRDNNRVRMEIMVEHEPVAEFVRRAIPELTEKLSGHDLVVESARVSTAERRKIEARDDNAAPGAGFFQASIHVVA